MARPRLRPTLDDEGVIDRLCERLISGQGLAKACEPRDMPTAPEVYARMAKDPEFATVIACAREAQQEAMIDETIDMADKATPEDHQVVKLRIWARQWRAAKLAPKRYGEKVTAELTGANGGPIQMDDTQAAARLASLLSLAQARKDDGGN